MKKALFAKLKEALISVLPVLGIVLILSFTPLAPLDWKERIVFLICAFFLIIGIGLFNLGADIAMSPIGRHVGEGLIKSGKIRLLFAACFLMGVLITVAEPDLSVLADQISDVVSSPVLILTVGFGVGIFLVLSVVRIFTKTDLTSMLLFFYMLLFAFASILITNGGSAFLPLAFDSGGVTTGPITVPFIMALGIGIAQIVGGRDADQNSFGLIALCSVGPVLSVLILSILSTGGSIQFPLPDYSMASDFGAELLDLVPEIAWDVAKSLLLMSAFFIVLQFFILKLPQKKLMQIAIGLGFTFVGLVIFLLSVTIGFMPVGYKIGYSMSAQNPYFLAGFAFIIGMVVVLAEPAVHVLNQQVEEVTNGDVTRVQMMIALAIGVGISIALSVIRMIFGFSLLYYLIPGYLISLGLSFFVPKLYTAIAFDSGGVASGPLTSSFILPMMIGACVSFKGADFIMDFAFGVVAMVAMTPLITIQFLGFRSVVSEVLRINISVKKILDADDAQIIYFK